MAGRKRSLYERQQRRNEHMQRRVSSAGPPMRQFEAARDYLRSEAKNHTDPVTAQALMQAATRAVLKAIDDARQGRLR